MSTMAELRRLNIEQQKIDGQSSYSSSNPTIDAVETIPQTHDAANAVRRGTASEEVREGGVEEASEDVSNPGREQSRLQGSAAVRAGARKRRRNGGSMAVSEGAIGEARAGGRKEGRAVGNSHRKEIDEPHDAVDIGSKVRAAIAMRRVYTGGVKASIDMSFDLSTRVQRYGIDHGKMPLRQLVLELLEAFLAEEGY